MKRAILYRIETYSIEIEVPDDATKEQIMDRLERGKFEDAIEAMDYVDCEYEVEIMGEEE